MIYKITIPATLSKAGIFAAGFVASCSLFADSSNNHPTFSKDVAPILYQNCVSCHRAGEIGPMPLTSYDEVKPFASLIGEHVTNRVMPPWGANPEVGKFSNDPSLSDEAIATITAWVAAGAPEGDARHLPELPALTSGWRMDDPAVVLSVPEPFEVLPTGRSVYGNFMVSTGFARDTFIQSSEVRPSLLAFTHHANVYASIDGEEHRVAGYTPGGAIRNYPPGVAKLIPANSELRVNQHYNPKGSEHLDPGTAFAFKLAQGPVKQLVYTDQSGNRNIDIPPGEANYELKGQVFEFEQDSHLISFMPRMNERGKDIQYILVTPDGNEQVVLDVPRFHYGWIFTYELAEPIAAPAGSKLFSLAHFDNSAGNPHNPDPSARVPYGPEILNAYFEYVLDAQDLRSDFSLSQH